MQRYQIASKFLDVVMVQQPSLYALTKWIADNCYSKNDCLYIKGDNDEVYVREC